MTALFPGQIDAGGLAETEPLRPIANGRGPQCAGCREEVDIARLGDRRRQIDVIMARPGACERIAAETVGPLQKTLAIHLRVRIDASALQQGGGCQRFEDRPRRQRHLGHAREERAPLVLEQPFPFGPVGPVGSGQQIQIEARRAGGHKHLARPHVHHDDHPSARCRALFRWFGRQRVVQ